MTAGADPGNVSALSSEAEALIEVTLPHLRTWRSNDERGDRDQTRGFLRDLVRKALATVEAERDGWKEQSASFCNAEVAALTTLQAAREQARALAEALRRRVSRHCQSGFMGWCDECAHSLAALASWDTSQKESRGEQSEGRGEGR